VVSAVTRWWFAPVALGRVAVLRLLAYLFIPLDILVTTSWVGDQAGTPGFYQPLAIAELLQLPHPTPALIAVLRAALLIAASSAAMATLWGGRRAVQATGAMTAALYLWWMVIAMSYGKVDHDRFAFLVLLAVLPTVGTARLGEQARSAAAGWAIRTVQVAVVATYFLAAWAKVRIGGWGWVNGGTLAWALIRRNTPFSAWLLHQPGLLRLLQWWTLIFELASPLLLAVRSDRLRLGIVGGLYAFHLVTFGALGIIFLPHLVALAAFLPLERLGRSEQARSRAWPSPTPGTFGVDGPTRPPGSEVKP
jgi:hypothetical protein